MKINKTKTTSIALILLFALGICLPAVKAPSVETRLFVSAVPNPVGIGQGVEINMWTQPQPPPGAKLGAANSITINGVAYFVFWNITTIVTDPNGKVTNLGPQNTDPSGGIWNQIVPDVTGTWTLQASWPAQSVGGNDYPAVSSEKVQFVVQEEQVSYWPAAQLPTGYWSRPITSQNREWFPIAGNWLEASYNVSAKSNPYTTTPQTAHVVWTIQKRQGGLVGGGAGDYQYSNYYDNWRMASPPVIINGRLYTNNWDSWYGGPGTVPAGVTCTDLRTGETIWDRKDIPSITCGQVVHVYLINNVGAFAYLWSTGSTYRMYDAFTGDLWATFTNATTGTIVMDNDGTMLVYTLNAAAGWVSLWNSTKALGVTNSWNTNANVTIDWKTGLMWNYTSNPSLSGVSLSGITDGVLIAKGRSSAYNLYAGYDQATGKYLWGMLNLTMPGVDARAINEGIFAQFNGITLKFNAYDAHTGNKLWESDPVDYPWGSWTDNSPQITGGVLYSTSYAGYIYAWDIKTGKMLWKFSSGNSGLETPYGQWSFMGAPLITNGYVFAETGEHTPNDPPYRGQRIFCIDAKTGEGVWNMTGKFQSGAIADGYLLSMNGYDGKLYCFGKGQTQTTITAPQIVSYQGTSVMLQGTVTDQSPGAKDTPAIADEYMTEWMEYQYEQLQMPNAKGVSVSLDTIDPNGNYVHIADVTTDIMGHYEYMYTPPAPGTYKIFATFAGSESYYTSTSQTALGVSNAAVPSPTASTLAIETINNSILTYTTAIGIAIIIAIAIVGILILRKKP